MFRARAVLFASACLALAPAAFAETHATSHKAHAKGHAAETASKKAKLRRAAEADEPPAAPHKAHATKASGTSKHHGHAAEEADAAPTKSSKRHKGAKVEEADATPSKSSRRHGKAAAAEEADATPAKASKRHGKASQADEEADAAPSKAHGAREGEGSPLVRADLKSTKACVAAHVRLHGRPHGSRARLALQGECAKEVEAARRRAEEEVAIRTWTPPHGPLIYQGAMPRSSSSFAAASAVAEPPIGAPAVPLPTLPVDPGTAPATQTAQADASTPPAAGAPASGSATVVQPPPPQLATGLFGLFHRRGAPDRKPGEPAPTIAELVGSDETRLKAQLGEPELMRAEGDGALWTYRMPTCALYVFLGRDAPGSGWKVKGAQAGPLKRGGPAPEVDVCLKTRS